MKRKPLIFSGPSRREVRRCRALRCPAYDRTTRPRSGSCKGPVRQKPAAMGTVSVHDVACPEAKIMRHGTKVHAGGAAGDPLTNVIYFVRIGFRCRRRVDPRFIGCRIGNQMTRPQACFAISAVTFFRHCDAIALFALSLARSLAMALMVRDRFRRRHYHPHVAPVCD